MTIISFGHKKRRGKDTAVNCAMAFARQYYPSLQFGILSFGDQIKKVSYDMFHWAGLELGMYYENNPKEIDELLAPINLSPRQIWDNIGLMGREIEPRVWVQMAIAHAPEADVLFCKDLRFPTEVDLIREFKGKIYRIDRSIPDGGKVDQALNFYTEWDGIIDNNGSIKDLNKKIKQIVGNQLNLLVPDEKKICPICHIKGLVGGHQCRN